MMTTDIVAAKGFTSIQVQLFEQRYCIPNGHRFTPFNVPMPDGQCPFCIDQTFREAMSHAGMPELAPDAALTPADIAALAVRSAASASSPEVLLSAPTTATRLSRVQRTRIFRRSIAQRSVG
jgi:hypothetical protein